MKKQLLLLSLLVSSCLFGFGQSSLVESFEVFTKLAHPRQNSGFSFNRDSILAKITAVPDSSATLATFVITLNETTNVDSLFFTLTNNQGQLVYNGANKLSVLRSNPSFRQSANTLYFTVGPYPYLKRFSASAQVQGNDGQKTSVKTFTKN